MQFSLLSMGNMAMCAEMPGGAGTSAVVTRTAAAVLDPVIHEMRAQKYGILARYCSCMLSSTAS